MMKRMMFLALCVAISAWGAADPNPYASYTAAMASEQGKPMAVEWQNANDAAIAAATSPDELVKNLASDETAAALCAQVRDPYASCALTLTVIAATSQYVVERERGCPFLRALAFWRTTRADQRKIWNRALLAAAEKSSDSSVQTFFLDQLRWCGCACQAAAIRALGSRAASKDVQAFAAWVASELDGSAQVKQNN